MVCFYSREWHSKRLRRHIIVDNIMFHIAYYEHSAIMQERLAVGP